MNKYVILSFFLSTFQNNYFPLPLYQQYVIYFIMNNNYCSYEYLINNVTKYWVNMIFILNEQVLQHIEQKDDKSTTNRIGV